MRDAGEAGGVRPAPPPPPPREERASRRGLPAYAGPGLRDLRLKLTAADLVPPLLAVSIFAVGALRGRGWRPAVVVAVVASEENAHAKAVPLPCKCRHYGSGIGNACMAWHWQNVVIPGRWSPQGRNLPRWARLGTPALTTPCKRHPGNVCITTAGSIPIVEMLAVEGKLSQFDANRTGMYVTVWILGVDSKPTKAFATSTVERRDMPRVYRIDALCICC